MEPFEVDQLREALAINPKTGCLDRNQRPTRQDTLKCCSNLIVLNNGKILLAHHSVRQFLETRLPARQFFGETFDMDTAQLELGQLCVAHLMSLDYSLALQPFIVGGVSQIDMRTVSMKTLVGAALPSWTHRLLKKPGPATMALPRIAPEPPSGTELPSFFHYAKDQWAPLTRGISKDSPYWAKFRKLSLEPNFSWQLHPWTPLGKSLDSHYMGLLGWAIVNRHLTLLDLLLTLTDCKPKTKIFNMPFHYYNNLPALHLAVRAGDIEIIRWLLQVCNLEKTDNYHRTSLHHAAETGQLEIVLLFLQTQANLKAQDNRGQTALHFAAENGHARVVEALINCGADVNQGDHMERTALFLAAKNGHETVVRILVDRGADINTKDSMKGTVFLTAAANSQVKIFWILVELGAGMDKKDALGWTAQWWDADLEAKDNHGPTMLLWAASAGYVDLVKVLLEESTAVNAKDKNGQTALLRASVRGNMNVVTLLLEKGADINAQNNDGWTALFKASIRGNLDMVKLLLEKGADINAQDNNGWTALFMASIRGNLDMVKLLLEKGADVNAQDNNGYTAMLRAAERGYIAICTLLLEKSADINAEDRNG